MIIQKKLGSGMFGTTYLVEIKGKLYALKIQHILPKDIKKNFTKSLWRELDLYDYILKIPMNDQKFFTKIHHIEIINNCQHQQDKERAWMPDPKGTFGKELAKLNKSKYCAIFYIDYLGDKNLSELLRHKELPQRKFISLLLQICKIIMILYNGGYSHNDLHSGNIMVTTTNEKKFDFLNHKIPYYGTQLVAIDYGEVMHQKFGIKYKNIQRFFIEDQELYKFREIFYSTMNIIMDWDYIIQECKRKKEKLPWEINPYFIDVGIKKLFTDYFHLLSPIAEKYLDIFPEARKLYEKVKKKCRKVKIIWNIINNKKNDIYFGMVWSRIEVEFAMKYPRIFMEIFGYCSLPKFLLPHDKIELLLKCRKLDDYLTTLISFL